MALSGIDPEILLKVNKWLEGNYDEETKNQIRDLLDHDPQEIVESFYADLEFGTGGLRGIMGPGTNRMNKYTVGTAAQGLANYLKKMFSGSAGIKVAIAYDSRNNSRYFAQISAEVLSANNIHVYLFDDLRPTPELSFAVRYLGCQGGIVITASHNPKEYNGFKAYWDDGGQLIPPHDKNVIAEVQKIKAIDDVKFTGRPENIEVIGKEIDDAYIAKVRSLSLSPEVIRKYKGLKIVYSPLHGSGTNLVPRALKAFGFENVILVAEQSVPDGNFPTVKSPNPEESAALELALRKARESDADIVLATDPDADRVGVAIKDSAGNFMLLNGNQAASLLIYYILRKWKENGKLTGKEYIVKTIVTSELIKDIAVKYGVESFDVLTGFKWIAGLIRKEEGRKVYIAGGEESYGYMVGDFVRDKDAVSACAMIAETAAWAASQGKTMFDLLVDLYMEFGFYKEKLISVVKKGISGGEEIKAMMDRFRNNPPSAINNSNVVLIKDYLISSEKDLVLKTESPVGLPVSNVLQFFLEDGSKISVRPSGTEPKIKFYFGVKEKLVSREDYDRVNMLLDMKVDGIIRDLGLA